MVALLSSIHKSNPHQESLGGYRCFCKSHSVEHFTSGKNLKKKNPGVPNGSDWIWQKWRIHHRPHPFVVKGGPHSLFSAVSRGKDGGLISCAFGETMVAQTSIGRIHLSPVRKEKIEWQDDTHNDKPVAIRIGGSPSSRNHVLRPMGTIWGKLSIKTMRNFCT